MKRSRLKLFIIVIISSCIIQSSAVASITRIDFSGFLTFGTKSSSGNFIGVLVANWDTGVVYDYYADVSYSTGQKERYSIFSNFDMVGVTQGSLHKQFWSDGAIRQYSVSPETEFSVSRYQRDQNGNLSVVPDPDWEMVLEISPRGIWAWSNDEYQIISCGNGLCWEQVSAFNAFGKITSLSTSTVPIPAAFSLFCSGLVGLLGLKRAKRLNCCA
jgi:hypothetical protein